MSNVNTCMTVSPVMADQNLAATLAPHTADPSIITSYSLSTYAVGFIAIDLKCSTCINQSSYCGASNTVTLQPPLVTTIYWDFKKNTYPNNYY